MRWVPSAPVCNQEFSFYALFVRGTFIEFRPPRSPDHACAHLKKIKLALYFCSSWLVYFHRESAGGFGGVVRAKKNVRLAIACHDPLHWKFSFYAAATQVHGWLQWYPIWRPPIPNPCCCAMQANMMLRASCSQLCRITIVNARLWKHWRGTPSDLPSSKNVDAFAYFSNVFSLLWYVLISSFPYFIQQLLVEGVIQIYVDRLIDGWMVTVLLAAFVFEVFVINFIVWKYLVAVLWHDSCGVCVCVHVRAWR